METAISELATAVSESLWEWIPSLTSLPCSLKVLCNRFDYRRYFVRQGAAIGIAENEGLGTAGNGHLQGCQGIFGIILETVEKMLRIIEQNFDMGRRKASESSIICRLSFSSIRRASRTCISQLLPKMVMAGVRAFNQGLQVGVLVRRILEVPG